VIFLIDLGRLNDGVSKGEKISCQKDIVKIGVLVLFYWRSKRKRFLTAKEQYSLTGRLFKMTKISLISLLIFLVFMASIAWSNIIHVPADQPTIQAGIDVAVNGDTVLVADDTWTGPGNKNLGFKGKAITVTSENGPENCFIDCEDNGRGFYFHNDETSSSVVSGFTIMNGYNFDSRGAGIYCYYSSPTITNNVISTNSAYSGHGGGIACYYSSAIITNNTIIDNDADFGGGVDCYYSSPTITNNVISENFAENGGGGIRFYRYSSPNGESQIANNIIIKNKALSWANGGGISCVYHSNPQIINNIIADNEASYTTGFGGGIYCQELYFPLKIYNNLIICNKAKQGGGIHCINNASPIITNNTISGNSSKKSGGAIYCTKNVSPTILNSILWSNTPQEIKLYQVTITVTYSNIKGGWSGEGNIDDEPLFVDLDNGDYHLQADSPCIDAGTPNGAPPDDIEGNPRDEFPDMGAYEYRGGGLPGDVDEDGNVTLHDAVLVLQYVVGIENLSPSQLKAADVTGNGTITAFDAALILQYTVGLIIQFPIQQGAPSLTNKDENQMLIEIITELENVSLTTEQKSILPRFKSLIGHQSLPSYTTLWQNYPNPFNPDTWLPYQLAKGVPVIIKIYNSKGRLVRSLNLGMQRADVYLNKDKAAYWNGKNSLGEHVASGVYFYTLQAGDFTATRRMLIVK